MMVFSVFVLEFEKLSNFVIYTHEQNNSFIIRLRVQTISKVYFTITVLQKGFSKANAYRISFFLKRTQIIYDQQNIQLLVISFQPDFLFFSGTSFKRFWNQ